MTTQTEKRYLQKLGRWIDGTLSHHWITLEIHSTHNRMVTYTLVGSSGAPITEPLRDLLDREYRPVAIGELPEQFKTGAYAVKVEKEPKDEQTVTAQELMVERPEMVESIIDLIIADSIASLVETDYPHLSDLFFESGADIVEKYKDSIKCMRLYSDYLVLHSLVQKVICNIGTELFCDMWDADESAALSEVLRCFGHGVSFWDTWGYKEFDFEETPQLKTTLEQPWNNATLILEKIAVSHGYSLIDDTDNSDQLDDIVSEQDTDFDQWLASNYSPAGEDASNGEQWYLSASPNEFMPISLSTLKKQYNLDKGLGKQQNLVGRCGCGNDNWLTCTANTLYCG